jgi:hypothetical protein
MTLPRWVRILTPKPMGAKVLLLFETLGTRLGSDAVLLTNVVQYGDSSFHSLLCVALGAFISSLPRPAF